MDCEQNLTLVTVGSLNACLEGDLHVDGQDEEACLDSDDELWLVDVEDGAVATADNARAKSADGHAAAIALLDQFSDTWKTHVYFLSGAFAHRLHSLGCPDSS